MEGKIYEAIAAVMNDVGAVSKSSENPNQHYKYRGIDAVMNALNPAMTKHKIFVVPEVIEEQREERGGRNGGVIIYSILKIRYTFFATDGSSVQCVVMGEAMDSGDKSMNKAMSAAFKYACFQTFCIPTEDFMDTEESDPEPTKEKRQPKAPKVVKSEKQLNEQLKNNIPEDQLPDPSRTPEYRAKRIREEIARTGVDEVKYLNNTKVKNWEDVSDAQFVALMEHFAKK